MNLTATVEMKANTSTVEKVEFLELKAEAYIQKTHKYTKFKDPLKRYRPLSGYIGEIFYKFKHEKEIKIEKWRDDELTANSRITIIIYSNKIKLHFDSWDEVKQDNFLTAICDNLCDYDKLIAAGKKFNPLYYGNFTILILPEDEATDK